MKATSFLALLSLLLISSPLFAKSKFPNKKRSFIIGADFQYFFAKVNGDGKYKSNSVEGTKFKYGTLGLKKDKKDIMGFGLFFGSQMHRLHFEYTEYSLSGKSILTSPLVVDTKTYISGSPLSTDLDAKWGRAYYELWDQTNSMAYSLLLGAELYKFDYSIYNSADLTHKNFKMQSITPLFGTCVVVGQGRYNLTMKGFYMPAFLKLVDYDTLDISAAFQFKFGNYMSIEAGYRYVDSEIQGNDGDQENGIRFKGLFIGLGIRY